MTNPMSASCEIIVLLDRSGSMETMKKDMEHGFDNFVKAQRKVPGKCALTLVQFDSVSTEVIHSAVPLSEVHPLTLEPGGGTPLLDAMGDTIKATGIRFKAMAPEARPDRVLFITITDGEENSSRKHTLAQVKAMVEHQTEKYGWTFTFLGANIDSFAAGAALGIKYAQTSNFSKAGAGETFSAMSVNTTSYREGGQFSYTNDQRDSMVPDAVAADAPVLTTTTQPIIKP